MTYKEYDINNIKLYIHKTNKFKTIKMNFMFINEYDKNDFTKHKLLNKILKKSTKNNNDEIKMSKKAVSLYNPYIRIFDIFKNIHEKNFQYTFINEKYSEEGMNKQNLEFLLDIIFNPNIINNEFEKSNFNLCKDELKISYDLNEENPNYVADELAYLNLSIDVPCKYQKNGCKKDLIKINEKNLYDFYLNEIKNSEIKIFVVGDVKEDDFYNLIKAYLSNIESLKENFKEIDYTINTFNKSKEIIEKKNFNQSILIMLYSVVNISEYERKYVLPLLNILLGGNSFKLFNNVREKNSLAYYISSYIIKSDSIFEIEAGISKENYNKTISLINRQIEEVKNCNITDEEMNNIINLVKSILNDIEDDMSSLLSAFIEIVHLNKKSPKELLKMYKKVTKEEISSLAKKLNLDVQFLLEGNDNENN